MQFVIGIFTAFFLAVLILTKKGRNRADIFLGIWMIVIGIHILGYYSFIAGIIYTIPELMWLNLPYGLIHGPMLYLYTESLTNPERFKGRKWLFHLVPPFILSLAALPIMFLPEDTRIMIYKTNGKGYESYLIDWTALQTISGLIYILLTGILHQQHKRRIHNQFSYQEKINLNWLRFLLYAMGITWIIIISGVLDIWIFSTSALFLVFIGFFGIKQGGIFTDQNTEIEPIDDVDTDTPLQTASNTEKKKYSKSGLTENAVKKLHQNLLHLMATEKIYTEPELTLVDLSTRLKVHSNYLSQVINDLEGVNFYDYINILRIQEFKRLVSLPENKNYTILSLAFECGFNSKSAFNRYFKKATGLTPSEYLKSINMKYSA